MNRQIRKIVVAYSGGLDTSVIVRWLKDKYGADVVGFNANLGESEDKRKLEKRLAAAGGSKLVVEDIREEFLREYCLPAMWAGAVYENKYFMATSLSRPLIAKKLIEVARKTGADAVAHGCTGKGNDQVRFEVTNMALAPDLEVLAPVREWEFKTREQELDYARLHNIPVTSTKKSIYSYDRNLWGISIECGPLENPWTQPPQDAYLVTTSPDKAPNRAQSIRVGFRKGMPVSIDGRRYGLVDLVERLNVAAGRHGVGRVDMLENRLVGIKSREVYEQPASTILHTAYRELQTAVIDRDTLHLLPALSDRYAQLTYDGMWFSVLRETLDALFGSIAKRVTGEVRLDLFKGQAVVTGRQSPNSLYSENLATYGEKDSYDPSNAKGFIRILGLPLQVQGELRRRRTAGSGRNGR